MVHVQVQVRVELPKVSGIWAKREAEHAPPMDPVIGSHLERELPHDHEAPPRRLGLFTVGTTAASGCFLISDATSQTYDVSGTACNSQNCPSCFITPTVFTSDILLTISNCATHSWGIGSATTTRSGVWAYTFINRG
eukprot:CAMPEP_0185911710 /NCGR_PEP_ID=MMETSP0196C-20130402/32349_1 /TAXON_ID=2932 /ORGANISM="Alexandrium fundyense, Strain CCMP1719" /LENGTH=136 /DNA_ID=CAMNT_0028632815 /DNA_START=14 /DNA_END=420 /DNA_ORIENTATION=+